MEELAAGLAGPPDGQGRRAGEAGLVGPADQPRHDVPPRGAEVAVAGKGEEVLDLAGRGQVRFVGRGAQEAGEALLAEAVQEGSPEEGPAAGDIDARGAVHDASAASAEQGRSLKVSSGWRARRRSTS